MPQHVQDVHAEPVSAQGDRSRLASPLPPRPLGPRLKTHGQLNEALKTANADRRLTRQENIRVLLELTFHAGPRRIKGKMVPGSDLEAFPSRGRIAERTGIRPANVSRAYRELNGAGYISYTRRDKANAGGPRSHLFFFHHPTLVPGERRGGPEVYTREFLAFWEPTRQRT